MHKLALVGKNIQHSKSQSIYEKLLLKKVEYSLLDYDSDKEIPLAEELLGRFEGISITAPYKKHFLNELDSNESPIKIINCLKKVKGKIIGTNTDYLACVEILNSFHKDKNINEYLILGDGAMADVIKNILEEKKLIYDQLSRSKHNLQKENINSLIKNNTLIINTCCREYKYSGIVSSNLYLWDLNYNLDHNAQLFDNQPDRYIDGMGLLELQAKYALSFWNLNNH